MSCHRSHSIHLWDKNKTHCKSVISENLIANNQPDWPHLSLFSRMLQFSTSFPGTMIKSPSNYVLKREEHMLGITTHCQYNKQSPLYRIWNILLKSYFKHGIHNIKDIHSSQKSPCGRDVCLSLINNYSHFLLFNTIFILLEAVIHLAAYPSHLLVGSS